MLSSTNATSTPNLPVHNADHSSSEAPADPSRGLSRWAKCGLIGLAASAASGCGVYFGLRAREMRQPSPAKGLGDVDSSVLDQALCEQRVASFLARAGQQDLTPTWQSGLCGDQVIDELQEQDGVYPSDEVMQTYLDAIPRRAGAKGFIVRPKPGMTLDDALNFVAQKHDVKLTRTKQLASGDYLINLEGRRVLGNRESAAVLKNLTDCGAFESVACNEAASLSGGGASPFLSPALRGSDTRRMQSLAYVDAPTQQGRGVDIINCQFNPNEISTVGDYADLENSLFEQSATIGRSVDVSDSQCLGDIAVGDYSDIVNARFQGTANLARNTRVENSEFAQDVTLDRYSKIKNSECFEPASLARSGDIEDTVSRVTMNIQRYAEVKGCNFLNARQTDTVG